MSQTLQQQWTLNDILYSLREARWNYSVEIKPIPPLAAIYTLKFGTSEYVFHKGFDLSCIVDALMSKGLVLLHAPNSVPPKIDSAIALLRRLVENDPWQASEVDGGLSCFYCREEQYGTEAHTKDCPYVAARKFLAAEPRQKETRDI